MNVFHADLVVLDSRAVGNAMQDLIRFSKAAARPPLVLVDDGTQFTRKELALLNADAAVSLESDLRTLQLACETHMRILCLRRTADALAATLGVHSATLAHFVRTAFTARMFTITSICRELHVSERTLRRHWRHAAPAGVKLSEFVADVARLRAGDAVEFYRYLPVLQELDQTLSGQ